MADEHRPELEDDPPFASSGDNGPQTHDVLHVARPPSTGSEPDLDELEGSLGVSFANRALLRQALVHKSLTNELERPGTDSNERLEFLGDAVLGAVVAEQLYWRFHDRDEGELTLLRSSLVRASTLARWARALELGRFVLVGRGEARAGGLQRDPLLAGAFEAVVGAVYLDRGYLRASELIRRFVAPDIEARAEGSVLDAKSRLQQVSQARFGVTPTYEVLEVSGLGHEPIFTIRVTAGGGIVATAEGRSKQTAQQAAATEALAWMERELDQDAAAAADSEPAPAC